MKTETNNTLEAFASTVSSVPTEWLDVEPWPEPVDGALLLDELAQLLRRFVVLPKWAAEMLPLWILHTYAFHLRDVSTYLGVESPEKRCGKTTLLTMLSEVVCRPVVAANISPSAFFRVIEENRPTLLIDEADTFLRGNDELRGILNSGYSRKTAYVVRVVNQRQSPKSKVQDPKSEGRGAKREVRSANRDGRGPASEGKTERTEERGEGNGEATDPLSAGYGAAGRCPSGEGQPERTGPQLGRFSCWCPKVMAAIGRLPDTLADRCIVIRMQRRTAREECERLRTLETTGLRRRCARFVADHAEEVATARPKVPAGLTDRAADIWEPLLALADLAGGAWPELARQAAVGLTASAQESNPIGSLLLDIFVLFVEGKAERMFSRALVEQLNRFRDRPWSELRRGKEITDVWLSQRLRPYGVRPRTLWIGEAQAKGYMQEDFMEVFRRYIPREEVEALKREAREGRVA